MIIEVIVAGMIEERLICVLCGEPGGRLSIPNPEDYERLDSKIPEGAVHPACDLEALANLESDRRLEANEMAAEVRRHLRGEVEDA
jgi:hypothetical protein